jgi:hypothetical protein
MKAALTESDEEDLKMAEGDDEWIRLPESRLGKIMQAKGTSVLSDHLYDLPDDQSREQVEQECSVMQDNDEKGGGY